MLILEGQENISQKGCAQITLQQLNLVENTLSFEEEKLFVECII